MAIDQQRLDRLDAGTTILPQADDQVESPLSIPDLGLLFSNQADPNRPNNIPRREADAGRVLLEQAVRCADRALALSYPRDRWFVRAGVWCENATRKTGFQTFVHPVDDMMRVIEQGGFEPVSSQSTVMWSADVFARKR